MADEEKKPRIRYNGQSLKLQYLPAIASFSWLVTLIGLLAGWASLKVPRYPSQNGTIPFVSDIGAQRLKPLFIIGCIITGVSFWFTIFLMHRNRHMFSTPIPVANSEVTTPTVSVEAASPANTAAEGGQETETTTVAPTETETKIITKARKSVRGLNAASWVALIFTSIGLLSFIMLSGFDVYIYPRIHSLFLVIFGVPLFIGLAGSITLNAIQTAAYPEHKWLRKALWIKALAATILLFITVAFSARMATAERPYDYQFDQAAILEWFTTVAADIYMLTYWYDLRHILRMQQERSVEPVEES